MALVHASPLILGQSPFQHLVSKAALKGMCLVSSDHPAHYCSLHQIRECSFAVSIETFQSCSDLEAVLQAILPRLPVQASESKANSPYPLRHPSEVRSKRGLSMM